MDVCDLLQVAMCSKRVADSTACCSIGLVKSALTPRPRKPPSESVHPLCATRHKEFFHVEVQYSVHAQSRLRVSERASVGTQPCACCSMLSG